MRFRIRELCIREYTKVISKDESNKLKQDLMESAVIKRKYTPLAYLKGVSSELKKTLEELDLTIDTPRPILPDDIIDQRNLERVDIVTKVGSTSNRSREQQLEAKSAINNFHKDNIEEAVLVYTDGSVKNRH